MFPHVYTCLQIQIAIWQQIIKLGFGNTTGILQAQLNIIAMNQHGRSCQPQECDLKTGLNQHIRNVAAKSEMSFNPISRILEPTSIMNLLGTCQNYHRPTFPTDSFFGGSLVSPMTKTYIFQRFQWTACYHVRMIKTY